MGLIKERYQDARRYGKRLRMSNAILGWFYSGKGTNLHVVCGSRKSQMESFNQFLELLQPWIDCGFFEIEVDIDSSRITYNGKSATWACPEKAKRFKVGLL